MKFKSVTILIILIIICMFFLTGCYSAEGLESFAYAVALGIDKGENNKIRLSLQFAILNDSSDSGGGSSQSKKSTVTTVDCSSVDYGIALINSYISKKVNLSHCKAIVISEEVAYEGVSEYISTLANDIEIRPNCSIIVSRCKASDYLENSEPTLETLSARYYEFTLNSSEYSGFTEEVTLEDFYSDMLNTTAQAHAILGGVNTASTNTNSNNLPLYDIDGSYKADEMPIKSETGLENIGIAVFNDDKLVGELTALESLCHLLVVDKLKNATISIPNPFDSTSTLSVYISSNKSPKISVELINGAPYIECTTYIEGDILTIDENVNYSNEENLKLVEKYANSFLEQNISSYLYKTSKEFKSDIANFGKYTIKNYATWNNWLESDWLYNYQNAFFSIKVNSNIQNSQLFTKT